jgi:hypothetical protein
MEEYPLATNSQRIIAASKHDLLWEEPVSQLGYGVDLVLGAVWDHKHGGIANNFTEKSKELALINRKAMLEINENMIFLMEIRWKDAPGSFLPEESDWWIREDDGSRKEGWLGGPEPYYYLDYKHPGFQKQVQLQAKIAVESGIYDGIMLDWWGSHGEPDSSCILLLKKIREAIGDEKIIIANNDRISPLPNSAPYLNGAFMEMHQRFRTSAESWKEIERHLIWFEENLRPPVVNCLEIQAGPESEMRAGLAMSLVLSDGYYLFAQVDNSDPSPDHLHDWFEIYDVDLGRPLGTDLRSADGAIIREFENGTVIYYPPFNTEVNIEFADTKTRASSGNNGKTFKVNSGD